MKLFVDDERQPPGSDWYTYRIAEDARKALLAASTLKVPIEILSLDHDLGDDNPTGYDIASWLEKEVWVYGMIPPQVLKVHSANPVGRKRILQAFESIVRFCVENGKPIPKIES